MIKNIIAISDTHFGCQFGLCPDIAYLDGGGEYHASRFQFEVYQKWLEFWDVWVPMVTKKEDYVIVFNGDIIDGVHHNSVTQISHNIEDQVRIALQVMEPIIGAKKCKGYYHVRGTEAHVGKSGQDEERIARQLGAIPDGNSYARNELWIELGNDLIHFSHHIGTTSSASYELTAVYKELVEAYNEAGRFGERPPSVIVRSHRHRQFECRVASEHGYAVALVTPGWQLKTPFVHRIALGRAGTPQIGGYLIRLGDEDGIYTRFKTWKTKRPEAVTL